MARERRDEWIERVDRWRKSGLTAREFASENGLNLYTLQHWSWKLGSAGRAKRCATAVEPIEFVELRDVPSVDRPIEVVLTSGVCVRVPAGFDDAALRRVLSVLGDR